MLKVTKKTGFYSLSLEDIFFGKPKGVKLTPRQPFKV